MTIPGYDEWRLRGPDDDRCPDCGGGGQAICETCAGAGGNHDDQSACEACEGFGLVECETCQRDELDGDYLYERARSAHGKGDVVMADKTKVILLREAWWESAKRDAFTVVCAFALILPGWWIGSGTLSFIGGFFLILLVLMRGAGIRKQAERSPEEAIAELQSMLAARGGGDD